MKRLILLLAVLVMLLCACGQTAAPAVSPAGEPPQAEPVSDPAPEDAAPASEKDAPAEEAPVSSAADEAPSDPVPEAALVELPVPPAVRLIPVGEAFAADLDGDGSFETVQLTLDDANGENAALTVWCGGEALNIPVSFVSPAENYVLFDLDTTDNFLELGLQDYGYSSDPFTTIYRCEDGALQCLGQINGNFEAYIDSDSDSGWRTITCYGDGYLQSYFRFSVLQTWFARASYCIERDALTLVPQEFYQRADEGISIWPDAGVHLTTLMELTAYAKPDSSTEPILLPEGTALDPLGSDNAGTPDYSQLSWVWFRRPDTGEDVYIQLSGFNYPAPDGSIHNVTDVFEPLSLFD